MAGDTVIATSPPPDGREWDCQCARCGSSLSFEQCEHCGGEGLDGHDCGEDTCCCGAPDVDNVECNVCLGRGSFPVCLSSAEWCQANPLPGRERFQRNTPEWFLVERGGDGG